MGPIVFGRARRYAERFRRFVVRHPDKLAELYHFGFQLVLGGKFVERFADREDLIVITGSRNFEFRKRKWLLHPFRAARTRTAATGRNRCFDMGRKVYLPSERVLSGLLCVDGSERYAYGAHTAP